MEENGKCSYACVCLEYSLTNHWVVPQTSPPASSFLRTAYWVMAFEHEDPNAGLDFLADNSGLAVGSQVR